MIKIQYIAVLTDTISQNIYLNWVWLMVTMIYGYLTKNHHNKLFIVCLIITTFSLRILQLKIKKIIENLIWLWNFNWCYITEFGILYIYTHFIVMKKIMCLNSPDQNGRLMVHTNMCGNMCGCFNSSHQDIDIYRYRFLCQCYCWCDICHDYDHRHKIAIDINLHYISDI